MNFNKDYYKILGISTISSREEIKSAYRLLAKQYHPDKNQGNASVEEIFKEINEAYEVLSNEITRAVYDEYKESEIKADPSKQEEKKNSSASSSNKKTYTRKYTVTKEHRIYLSGFVSVKFWSEEEIYPSSPFQSEFIYKINPTEAELEVKEDHIFASNLPRNFQRSYSESELFKSPIPQPIKCSVLGGNNIEYYFVEVFDIRIKDPELEGITKHEKQSLGTLKGVLYGYAKHYTTEDRSEEVTECFGPTGEIEFQEKDGKRYVRREYFHQNCTKYWGPWEPIPGVKVKKRKPVTPVAPVSYEGCASGCSQLWWLPLSVLFFVFFPHLLIGLLILFGFGLLFYFGGSFLTYLGRLLNILAWLLIGFLIFSAFRSCSSAVIPLNPQSKGYDSLKTTYDPIAFDNDTLDTGKIDAVPDTLINHYIKWSDFDSNKYETTLSIRLSDLKSSMIHHRNMGFNSFGNPAQVYKSLLEQNSSYMQRVYMAFDSIGKANNLTEANFASMVVSCVQSIPYYLVLDKGCDPSEYNDNYIQGYLSQCATECCIGYQAFGVRTPIEFMGDLKGDCDTRSLMLFHLLSYFGYDVALLTSDYYKHAVIAIHYEKSGQVLGVSKNINSKSYYLWETTTTGFRSGEINPSMENVSKWDVTLLNNNQ